MADKELVTFKLLLIGDSGTGKSSILLRFIDDKFDEEQAATIGVDFKVKNVDVDDMKVKLTVWDTAGQERFRTLTSSYYRGAHGVILVFDVCSRESFDNLETWFNELETYASSKDVVKLVIGNKIDASKREVTKEEGEAFAKKMSTMYIECSAKTKQGIDQAFLELVHKIVQTPSLWQRGKKPAGVSIHATESQPEQPSCAC